MREAVPRPRERAGGGGRWSAFHDELGLNAPRHHAPRHYHGTTVDAYSPGLFPLSSQKFDPASASRDRERLTSSSLWSITSFGRSSQARQ